MAASTKINGLTLSAALLLSALASQALTQSPSPSRPATPHPDQPITRSPVPAPSPGVEQVNTLKEVFERLFSCWKPPAASVATPMDITVLVSFNRSGAIMGRPRITYESPKATDSDRLAYRLAVMEALQRCSPMPFTETWLALRQAAPSRSSSEPTFNLKRREHGCHRKYFDPRNHAGARHHRDAA